MSTPKRATGNHRPARLARWLRGHVPTDATRLVMVCALEAETEETILSIPRTEALLDAERTAYQIDTAVGDLGEECQHNIAASVRWLSHDNETLSSTRVRWTPSDSDPSLPWRMGSDWQSQTEQSQKHLEAMARLYVTGNKDIIEQAVKLTDLMAARASSAESRAAKLESQLEAAREAHFELRKALQDMEGDALDPMAEKVLDTLTQLLGSGDLKSMLAKRPPDGPATPTSNGAPTANGSG